MKVAITLILISLFAGLIIFTEDNTLHPVVKGSIYESGETATIWGSCLDGNNHPAQSTTATVTVFYPNTSIVVNQSAMDSFNTGEFNYTLIIPNVTGTYSIRFNCTDGTNYALSYGEIQFTPWVDNITIASSSSSSSGGGGGGGRIISPPKSESNGTTEGEVKGDKKEDAVKNPVINLIEQIQETIDNVIESIDDVLFPNSNSNISLTALIIVGSILIYMIKKTEDDNKNT
jgi:hypothetical protein